MVIYWRVNGSVSGYGIKKTAEGTYLQNFITLYFVDYFHLNSMAVLLELESSYFGSGYTF